MNNYGLIVNEIGMERAMDALVARVLSPVAEALFPEQGGGALDGHHSFLVQYQEGADLGLDMHTDDSDVTFNVCLGKDFTGAGLQFCGVLGGTRTASGASCTSTRRACASCTSGRTGTGRTT